MKTKSKINDVKFCDNCEFSCSNLAHLERHFNRDKHVKLCASATEKCELCNELFTPAGLTLHLARNEKLIKMWKRRDNWVESGYRSNAWQIGFNDTGGHQGDDLPICNNFYAFNKMYPSFDSMREACIQYWKKNLHTHAAGNARNPWENLDPSLKARHVPMNDELFDQFCKNRDASDKEALEKMRQLENPFAFTERELYYGFLINLDRSGNQWPERTVEFIEFLGFKNNYHRVLLNIKEIVKKNEANLLFVPIDDNVRCKEGDFFFVDDEDNENGPKPDTEIGSICYYKYNPKSDWNDLNFDLYKTEPEIIWSSIESDETEKKPYEFIASEEAESFDVPEGLR